MSPSNGNPINIGKMEMVYVCQSVAVKLQKTEKEPDL